MGHPPLRKKILLILATIWLSITIVTSPYILRVIREKGNVERKFSEFSSALRNGMLEQAYAFCAEEFKKATPFEEFEKQQKTLVSRHGELRAVRMSGYEITVRDDSSTWSAVVEATLEFQRKKTEFRYWLRYEGGRWVLYGYRQIED